MIRTFLGSLYLQVLSAAVLMILCIYIAGYTPLAAIDLPAAGEMFSGWVPGISRGVQQSLAEPVGRQVLFIISVLSFAFVGVRTFNNTEVDSNTQVVAIALIVSNPLLLWCCQYSATVALPFLSLVLWLTCLKLHIEPFSRSSVLTGMILAFFVTASPVTGYFSIPLITLIALLLPLRLIQLHGVAPFFIVLAPLALVVLAGFYWQSVVPDVPSAQPAGEATDLLTSAWLQRHDQAFATAAAELAIWAVLISPALFWQALRAQAPFMKRFAVFCIAVPVVAAGLATDFGQATTPLPYLAALVTAQAASPITERSHYLLASLYVSWLGSALAIWYYAV